MSTDKQVYQGDFLRNLAARKISYRHHDEPESKPYTLCSVFSWEELLQLANGIHAAEDEYKAYLAEKATEKLWSDS